LIELKVKKTTQFAARGTIPDKRLVRTFHEMTNRDLTEEGYRGFRVGRLVKYSKAPTVLDHVRNMMAGEIVAVRATIHISFSFTTKTVAGRKIKSSQLNPDQVFLLVRGGDKTMHIGTANDFVLT